MSGCYSCVDEWLAGQSAGYNCISVEDLDDWLEGPHHTETYACREKTNESADTLSTSKQSQAKKNPYEPEDTDD